MKSREAFSGELIDGALVFSTEEEVMAREVRVALEGEERTRVRSSRPGLDRLILPSMGYIGQRREIPGVERILTEKRRIEPPGTRIPFSLRAPVDALPSYAGRFSRISWVLKARISKDPPPDLLQIAEVTMFSRGEDTEAQIAMSPEGAAVGLSLEVEGCKVQPDAHITGWITISKLKRKPREITIEMLAHEVARAKSRGWQEIEVKDTLLAKQRVFVKEEMVVGARKAFDLDAPGDLPPLYRGEWSSVDILLRAVAKIPLRPNISVTIPLRARGAPPSL
ncbi:MAG: hypothetical protein OEY99_04885 [Aigarchaeota archaeon]|nr:hypothetical protein [Aigarchaeota archaeon]MDH5703530.1 hypothetical protein [Aigarchaeota archaeon]